MDKRKNFLIVLDLDNTLIDTTIFPIPGKYSTDPLLNSYPRPYLDCFMTYLLSNYHVGVWTAALPIWKHRVLNNTLKPYEKHLLFALSREHVLFDKYDSVVKPLHLIWTNFPNFGPHNTLIIDDTYSTGLLNQNNHLHIKPFIATSPQKDTELLKIYSILENTKLDSLLIKEKYNKLK
jgi:NLI interacting factor-like phosphatase